MESIDEESVHLFYRVFESSLDAIRGFCTKTPGFMDLDPQDRDLLYQSAMLELFALRFAYRSVWDAGSECTTHTYSPDRNQKEAEHFQFCSGSVLLRKHVQLFMGSRWLSGIERLSLSLHNMDLDISAFACLCALALITGESGGSRVSLSSDSP